MNYLRIFKPLNTTQDYEKALSVIEKHFDAKAGSFWGNIVEVLAVLVERYEDEHFPMESPDPIEAIKFRMEQLGLKPKDLAELLGQKSHVSEILKGERGLSLQMIRKLYSELKIPPEVLLQEY